MKTIIRIWSASGNTPITKRGKNFCDLLIDTTFECAEPMEAHNKVKDLIASTEHAASGFFNMPEWENQNTREGWVN